MGKSTFLTLVAFSLVQPIGAFAGSKPFEEMRFSCTEASSTQKTGSLAGLRSCTKLIPDIQKLLEDRVRQQAEKYYEGCDLDPLQKEPVNGCYGKPVPRETCNRLSNGVPPTFNRVVENEQTHHGASCGQWPYFAAHLGGTTCHITPDYTRAEHMIEDAYNRGAWIQALNCFHNQLKMEVEKGKINLTRFKSGDEWIDGPCFALAEEAKSYAAETVQASNNVAKNISGQANVADLENCTGDESASISNPNTDIGRVRVSSCNLSAGRRSLEAMYMQIAACEVWIRAGKSYEKFLSVTPGSDDVKAAARRAINGRRSSNESHCTTGYVLGQYKSHYFSNFDTKANRIWSEESCKSE